MSAQLLDQGAKLDPQATRRLIESYTPIDVVSAEYKDHTLRLIDRVPELFANRYNYDANFPGHLTSQAVVYNPDLCAIAMMHHKKLDIWVGAGGHVEPGDTDLIATARREAAEELGFSDLTLAQLTPFDIDIHGFPAKKDQPDHLHFDIRFLFTTVEQKITPNDESTDCRWVPVQELQDFLPLWLSNSRLVRGLQTRYLP